MLKIIKTFDLLPKLTESFDLVVQSCAIRSSDQTPVKVRKHFFFATKISDF